MRMLWLQWECDVCNRKMLWLLLDYCLSWSATSILPPLLATFVCADMDFPRPVRWWPLRGTTVAASPASGWARATQDTASAPQTQSSPGSRSDDTVRKVLADFSVWTDDVNTQLYQLYLKDSLVKQRELVENFVPLS